MSDKQNKDKLVLDTFLLSCRILGRKVEDVILRGVMRCAKELGMDEIEAIFFPTEKNKPVLEFIERMKWETIESNQKYTKYCILASDLTEKIQYIDFYFNEDYIKNLEKQDVHSKDLVDINQGTKTSLNKLIDYKDYDLCDVEILEKTKHKE